MPTVIAQVSCSTPRLTSPATEIRIYTCGIVRAKRTCRWPNDILPVYLLVAVTVIGKVIRTRGVQISLTWAPITRHMLDKRRTCRAGGRCCIRYRRPTVKGIIAIAADLRFLLMTFGSNFVFSRQM